MRLSGPLFPQSLIATSRSAWTPRPAPRCQRVGFSVCDELGERVGFSVCDELGERVGFSVCDELGCGQLQLIDQLDPSSRPGPATPALLPLSDFTYANDFVVKLPSYYSLYLLDIPIIYLSYIYHPFVNLFDIDLISTPILLPKHIFVTNNHIGYNFKCFDCKRICFTHNHVY
eukprot:g55065.t1